MLHYNKDTPLFSARAEVFPGTVFSSISVSFSSPHARRYFPSGSFNPQPLTLFSARAEVFPCGTGMAGDFNTLLRTRGGISFENYAFDVVGYSSPHARRYFQLRA
ncbi:hypothetical protein SAMN05421878_1028 [Actinobaculum suis]|uniref:Uncharacterized protein n=1 Tax=Actinobaculum suis TaxID=1657 RepID=A0A1G6ZZ63_9ACTO|nr:hypothetical protein SAMN05421878_1028 [Actinobaculum suis]